MLNKKMHEKFSFFRYVVKGRPVVDLNSTHHNLLKGKVLAFTLAEVLITLGIIGVVAALTIPTLIKNYEKKVTITKLQKVLAVLNQIAQMPKVNGTYLNYMNGETASTEKTKEAVETFWLPYLKGAVINPDGIYPYTEQTPFRFLNGSKQNMGVGTKYEKGYLLLTTPDGIFYLILIAYADQVEKKHKYSMVNDVHVDLNGQEGPNVYGKDVFLFSIDFDKGVAYPYIYDATTEKINNNCRVGGHGVGCLEKIRRDGWQIKDDYPW